jgi:hypothetical protein
MKRREKKLLIALAFALFFTCLAFGQNTTTTNEGKEPRVALTEQAIAFDAYGNVALGGRLRATTLNGAPDAPIREARFVVENRSPLFYLFVSGVVTFYDATGVRCGQGVWNLDALAAGEAAEVDAPDLRVTCNAATWRIVATSLATRNGDRAVKPPEPTPTPIPSPSPTLVPTPAPVSKPSPTPSGNNL